MHYGDVSNHITIITAYLLIQQEGMYAKFRSINTLLKYSLPYRRRILCTRTPCKLSFIAETSLWGQSTVMTNMNWKKSNKQLRYDNPPMGQRMPLCDAMQFVFFTSFLHGVLIYRRKLAGIPLFHKVNKNRELTSEYPGLSHLIKLYMDGIRTPSH